MPSSNNIVKDIETADKISIENNEVNLLNSTEVTFTTDNSSNETNPGNNNKNLSSSKEVNSFEKFSTEKLTEIVNSSEKSSSTDDNNIETATDNISTNIQSKSHLSRKRRIRPILIDSKENVPIKNDENSKNELCNSDNTNNCTTKENLKNEKILPPNKKKRITPILIS